MNGLFNLDGFEDKKNDDLLESTIFEGTEAGCTNGCLPGEQPASRPKDETPIKVSAGKEITPEMYNNAMNALKKSFKEAVDILEMMEQCNIVETNTMALQEEATNNAILESFENGPLFEKVDRDDKDAVKEITKKIRSKLKGAVGNDGKFYQPSRFARWLLGGGWWSMRLWQIAGAICIEEGNVDTLCKGLTEKLADDLGEYKILPVAVMPSIIDLFRTHFNWKNTMAVYFLLVDKKLDNELKQEHKKAVAACKEACAKDEK